MERRRKERVAWDKVEKDWRADGAEYNVAVNWRVVSKLFVRRWTCFESVEEGGVRVKGV